MASALLQYNRHGVYDKEIQVETPRSHRVMTAPSGEAGSNKIQGGKGVRGEVPGRTTFHQSVKSMPSSTRSQFGTTAESVG